MSIQESDPRLTTSERVEWVQAPDQAAIEIALHFYSFADGEEDYFHMRYFSLEDDHHSEIETHLLKELEIDKDLIVRTEEKQCIKISGATGLFTWADINPYTREPYGVYYSAEVLRTDEN